MNNEELALKIQTGENHYEELWNRVKGFIYKQAFSYSRYFPDSTVEVDDLVQGGYLALCEAVRDYAPDAGGNLLTLLKYKLRRIWRAMYGLTGKADALNVALSLDEPIDDEEETPRLDSIPDPAAEAAFSQRDEQIFRDELRDYLEKALDAAPHGDVMRRRYFNGETGKHIAESMGVSPQRVHQYEADAKRYLRHGPFTPGLIDFNVYHGTGFQSWKDNRMSVEERFVIHKEQAETWRGYGTSTLHREQIGG